MSTRLLSALTEIEHALQQQTAAQNLPAWQVTRMVNYHHQVGRMTLTPPAGDPTARRGAIFLQVFLLADGALCLKANLSWHGSDAFPSLPVYSTPHTDWSAEFARIADAWLAGPPAELVADAQPEPLPQLAELAS